MGGTPLLLLLTPMVPQFQAPSVDGVLGLGYLFLIRHNVRFSAILLAKVAELVDAQDLGSCGFMPWGFESPLSHAAFGIGVDSLLRDRA